MAGLLNLAMILGGVVVVVTLGFFYSRTSTITAAKDTIEILQAQVQALRDEVSSLASRASEQGRKIEELTTRNAQLAELVTHGSALPDLLAQVQETNLLLGRVYCLNFKPPVNTGE